MCFSMEWLKTLLIAAVVVGVIFAILKIIVPLALSQLPQPFQAAVNVLAQILWVILYGAIIIFLIIIAFDLISCLWSWAGGSSLLPHGR
jgi:flagellar biosynthesis protein FlhB